MRKTMLGLVLGCPDDRGLGLCRLGRTRPAVQYPASARGGSLLPEVITPMKNCSPV